MPTTWGVGDPGCRGLEDSSSLPASLTPNHSCSGRGSIRELTPWRPSGWDSALSLPRARVQSLLGELRSVWHGQINK